METLHDLKTICRLCLERSQHLEPLFDEPSALVGKLQTLTQLQMTVTDGWPNAVCPPCIDALNAADRFRSKCLDSHRQLETFYSTLPSNSIVIKEERLDLEDAGPSYEGVSLDIKEEPDSVCDPLLFVNAGAFHEEMEFKEEAMDTRDGSESGGEQSCRVSDPDFQEDSGRRRAHRTGASKKTFSRVLNCCKTNFCCQKISEEDQRGIFSKFYTMGDKNKQNSYLSGLMTRKSIARPTLTPKSGRHRSNAWLYFVQVKGERKPACKALLCSLLQIHKSRIDVLQTKQVLSRSVDDMKGRHDVRPTRISEDDWALARKHCESIPNKRGRDSSLNYFCDPDLTLQALYGMFQDFYQGVTGKELNHISFSTYQKYFNKNINFTFRQPCTFVCNLCFENGMKGIKITRQEKAVWDVHKRKVKSYNTMKNKILGSSDSDTLIIEFDYGDNLALPKLPVSEQVYKRLLWLHLFNVHVHNTSKPYFFYFMEGEADRGPNSVCSFIDTVLVKEMLLNPGYKNIVCFSDACSGQNRNYSVLKYFAMKAAELNVNIKQIFPVRGHSYCQCDRNFASYSKPMKRQETFETPLDYVEIISKTENCEILEGIVLDYDAVLKTMFVVEENADLSKAVVIEYKPSLDLHLSSTYSQLNMERVSVTRSCSGEMTRPSRAAKRPIGRQKRNDVLSLLRYVSPANHGFYMSVLEGEDTLDPEGSDSNSSDSELDY